MKLSHPMKASWVLNSNYANHVAINPSKFSKLSSYNGNAIIITRDRITQVNMLKFFLLGNSFSYQKSCPYTYQQMELLRGDIGVSIKLDISYLWSQSSFMPLSGCLPCYYVYHQWLHSHVLKHFTLFKRSDYSMIHLFSSDAYVLHIKIKEPNSILNLKMHLH